MLKTHQSIAIPDYLLSNYLKLGVTDKEFIMLLHFNAIPDSGKSAWQIVAERMGYQTEAPITKLVGSLVDKGLIELNGRGFDLDATKLYNACLQMMDKPETVEIIITQKPKRDKKTSSDYEIAKQIKEKYGLAWNLHSVASQIKSLKENGVPETDFMEWVNWMDSGNRWYAETKNVAKPSVRIDRMTYDNYERWIKLGRPAEYQNANLQVL